MGALALRQRGPRQVGLTLNSDTPYGSATLDLKDGPMVVELPPGAYIGLINDHNQSWVLDMGITGPDGSKGGKPDYKGKMPKGYYVGKSATYKVLLAVRAAGWRRPG